MTTTYNRNILSSNIGYFTSYLAAPLRLSEISIVIRTIRSFLLNENAPLPGTEPFRFILTLLLSVDLLLTMIEIETVAHYLNLWQGRAVDLIGTYSKLSEVIQSTSDGHRCHYQMSYFYRDEREQILWPGIIFRVNPSETIVSCYNTMSDLYHGALWNLTFRPVFTLILKLLLNLRQGTQTHERFSHGIWNNDGSFKIQKTI